MRGDYNDEFMFPTREAAQAALEVANKRWADFGDEYTPTGRISPASEKDGMIELEGDQFCVLNEHDEMMVCTDGNWITVV
jgi:hypothetical protein